MIEASHNQLSTVPTALLMQADQELHLGNNTLTHAQFMARARLESVAQLRVEHCVQSQHAAQFIAYTAAIQTQLQQALARVLPGLPIPHLDILTNPPYQAGTLSLERPRQGAFELVLCLEHGHRVGVHSRLTGGTAGRNLPEIAHVVQYVLYCLSQAPLRPASSPGARSGDHHAPKPHSNGRSKSPNSSRQSNMARWPAGTQSSRLAPVRVGKQARINPAAERIAPTYDTMVMAQMSKMVDNNNVNNPPTSTGGHWKQRLRTPRRPSSAAPTWHGAKPKNRHPLRKFGAMMAGPSGKMQMAMPGARPPPTTASGRAAAAVQSAYMS